MECPLIAVLYMEETIFTRRYSQKTIFTRHDTHKRQYSRENKSDFHERLVCIIASQLGVIMESTPDFMQLKRPSLAHEISHHR